MPLKMDAKRTYSICFKPHWLMSLFGAKTAVLSLGESGFELNMNGRIQPVRLVSLKRDQSIKDGVFFSTITFATDKGRIVLDGLLKNYLDQSFKEIRSYYLSHLIPDVTAAADQISTIIEGGYLREADAKQAQTIAQKAFESFGEVPEFDEECPINLTPFEWVAYVANWQASDIKALQQAFIDAELTRYQSFFDRVESQPLTQKQREACVINEENNLVLAGAGTGKTSTMVGRAGYLIESGQAKPQQILMLAFANKAAKEMQTRLDAKLNAKGITATTFHKLGKEIIAKVEGKQPSITPFAEDDKLLAWQVNEWFEALLKQPDYQETAIRYFAKYLYPDANEFDFESEGEYYDFLLANDIRTLKGEQVKSLGECLVANYLFKQGIEYRYEPPYQHDTATQEYRQYRPDFYLPQHDVYIEYIGTDRNGNTAPYINAQEYNDSLAWKRSVHEAQGTTLIELFHYQTQEGMLFNAIDHALSALRINCDPLPPEAVLETLREFGAIQAFSSLLTDLLKRYRANGFETERLVEVIQSAERPHQVSAALNLLKPIVDAFESMLKAQGLIDFDDMIHKAIEYVKTGRFVSPWTFILVDEFQDISEPRARLIQLLKTSVPGATLFGVGDDWQAIYRFTGSDLTLTTQFESVFGPTRITPLDLTFRFNNRISNVATRFVLENPSQLAKELTTQCVVNKPSVSVLRADNRDQHGPITESRLARVLDKIVTMAGEGASVLLLSRFGFYLPDQSERRVLEARYPNLALSAMTIHASKGKEADYVVLLGLETGKFGFPSKKQTHPLLDAFLPNAEAFEFAEERRLFYVALTRAKHRAYLIADMAVASEFVIELIKGKYDIELAEFDTNLTQHLFHLMKCVRCKTGTLVQRTSQHGSFLGCSKYPLCQHKERVCQKCSSPMVRQGRFKVCLDASCAHIVPICPKCGAEMVKRRGQYGEFWGCRNYGNSQSPCTHTENTIDVRLNGPHPASDTLSPSVPS
jgi:DNA helicase-4